MNSKNELLFIFNSHVDSTSKINVGRLSLNRKNGNDWETSFIWTALSSTGTKQFFESWNLRGGLLPPQYRLQQNKSYSVEVRPIFMPDVKGVNGNFYKINPHIVKTDKGTERADFGIHLDANIQGSLGCIVLAKDKFKDFEQTMGMIYNEGIKVVPLLVFYGG